MLPKRVLIVEDVETMRGMLEHLLQGIPGFAVSGMAGNVWEARLELSRRRPDLVLLDEILPGESSYDLVLDLKAQGIPVLLLTGIEKPTHSVMKEAAGRLVKPTWDTLPQDQKRFQAAMTAALGA